MILEAINFAATLAISPRKNFGELDSSVRLWGRARRCADKWQSHEEHCKAFIRNNLPESRRVVAVLGSGLLRDVPIKELSVAFRDVRLYDLQHLATVQLWARMRDIKNVTFINQDLSEGLDFLAEEKELDLVISANLLSQLGVKAREQGKSAAEVMRAHVDGLVRLPGRRLLMTDVEYAVVSRDSRFIENFDLMHGVALPPALDSWSWTVAPFGEIDRQHKAVHRVVAIRF